MNEQKILKNFGINFKHYRNKTKMTQDTIVEATGFSKSYISNVENGRHNISLINAIKLAKIVNKTVDELIQEL